MNELSPSGILIVNKHAGVTSNDIVVRIRRLFGTRQVGHTGTLDPMATGVLPVLIGRAVKASDFIMAENKRYTAEFHLGIRTDTEDVSGAILTQTDNIPDTEAVLSVCQSFIGEIMQTPPMYSARKVNGRKLVDLAREGITVAREARPVTVSALEVTPLTRDTYRLDVRCSKGTYIRTLCADIGEALGCGAAMSALCRTESGPFSLAEAVSIDTLETEEMHTRLTRLIPLERFFTDLPILALPPFYARLARNGCEIYQKKIASHLPDGALVRLYRDGEFFALGRVSEYPDGSAVKAVKIFSL